MDRRLEEVAKAAGGGCCRLQTPLKLALAVRGAVARHRLGALEGGYLPPFQGMPGTHLCQSQLHLLDGAVLGVQHVLQFPLHRPQCARLQVTGLQNLPQLCILWYTGCVQVAVCAVGEGEGGAFMAFITPTPCFLAMGPSLLQSLAVRGWWGLGVGGWRLVPVGSYWRLAVGASWQLLAAGGWCQLAAIGGWRLAVGGGWLLAAVGGWRSLEAVLKGCP